MGSSQQIEARINLTWEIFKYLDLVLIRQDIPPLDKTKNLYKNCQSLFLGDVSLR